MFDKNLQIQVRLDNSKSFLEDSFTPNILTYPFLEYFLFECQNNP